MTAYLIRDGKLERFVLYLHNTCGSCHSLSYLKTLPFRVKKTGSEKIAIRYIRAAEWIGPILEEHLKIYGNRGKWNPSYLSANTYEEIIDITEKQVLCTILEEAK